METLTELDLYGCAYDTFGNHIVDIYGNDKIIKNLVTISDEFTYMKSIKRYELNEIENKKIKCNDEIRDFLEQNKDFVNCIIIGQSVPEEYKVICFTEERNVICEHYEYKNIKHECYLRVDPCLLEILSHDNNFEYYLNMAKNNNF